MSLPEVLLWQELRQRPAGLKFRRQHAVEPYTLDFYCAAARHAIEVDGAAHDGAGAERDIGRDAFLTSKGLTILRIPASDILSDPANVSIWISEQAPSPLHPAAPRRGPPPRTRGGSLPPGRLE